MEEEEEEVDSTKHQREVEEEDSVYFVDQIVDKRYVSMLSLKTGARTRSFSKPSVRVGLRTVDVRDFVVARSFAVEWRRKHVKTACARSSRRVTQWLTNVEMCSSTLVLCLSCETCARDFGFRDTVRECVFWPRCPCYTAYVVMLSMMYSILWLSVGRHVWTVSISLYVLFGRFGYRSRTFRTRLAIVVHIICRLRLYRIQNNHT